MTIIAVITQAAGRYCLDSLSPAFAHVWTAAIEAICVTFAMYCLIQFYYQLKDDISEHKPLLKVLAIKLVIFLCFWQTVRCFTPQPPFISYYTCIYNLDTIANMTQIIINFLTSSGAIKESAQIAIPDVKIGIPCLLLCIEMAIFATLHLWAYPWGVYDISRSPAAAAAAESGASFMPTASTAYKGGAFGWKAFLDAFNPWDLVKAVARGFKWMVLGRRNREEDVSYKQYASQSVPGSAGAGVGMGKVGKYQQLSGEEAGFEDQRTVMPGRIGHQGRDEFGPEPSGRVESSRSNEDTTYHGVVDDRIDPSAQWRHHGR